MRKSIVLAIGVISISMLSLPALAAAGTWELDPGGQTFNFSAIGATALTTAGDTIACAQSNGSGSYSSRTAGTVRLEFEGCVDELTESACNTAGKAAGEIVTETLTLTNVYLEPGPHKPGLTMKGSGSEEKLATFTCFFGLVPVKVTGTLLGEMEDAATVCNTEVRSIPFVFESTAAGSQKWKQVTTTGSLEDLTAKIGEATETASQDATGFLERGLKVKPTCTS